MKQFFAFFLLSSALVAGIDGCEHRRISQIKPVQPALPPESTLPPGIPTVTAPMQTAFELRYQDIVIGPGAEAEPNKTYKVHYTGWLAADGHKFDSSYDHKTPIMDKEGKPELDSNGKPEMRDGEPISFPQGFGRVIPGFDQGFTGMHVGGKRRLFIPWQLAYGARGRPGPNAANPGIPPKADLIFDIELVDQSDLETQMPMGHQGMGQPMRGVPHYPAGATKPSDQPTPPPTGTQTNPGAPPPAGTPPPATPPTSAPPPEKPQSN
jgi:peptidylprolyl isomerase